MRPETNAVIFDLDDTLYPYRRFQLSGLVEVARELEARTGLDRRLGFRAMHRSLRGPSKGREVQACLEQYDLPADSAAELVEVLRHHEPRLRLSRSVARVLGELRAAGWKVGVLTNGTPSIQQRKIAALGLRDRVDAVVCAAEVGSGVGKPEPDTFARIASMLGVPAKRTIVIGNDEAADVEGAVLSGMRAVRCDIWMRQSAATRAAAVVDRISDIPVILRRLVQEDFARHAA